MRREFVVAKSSEDVAKQLQKAKESKKEMLNGLRAEISSNNSFIKSTTRKKEIKAVKKNEEQMALEKINKQKSMGNLSKSIKERIRVDRSVKTKLKQFDVEQVDRQVKLEKRIQEVKRRNQLRIKELDEFERRYIKKINEGYIKDKLKEQKLLEEYERVLEKEEKLKLAKEYRKAVELEDWRNILEEKKKLGKMVEQYKKKQNTLVKQQNQTPEKKPKEPEKQEKQPPPEMPQIKAGDAKEMGNQYLQFAKKMQKQPTKPKRILMDINLKCIDYSKQMMNKLARNTGDLSRLAPPSESPNGTIRETKSKDLGETKEIRQKQREQMFPVFEIKEDEQTKKYLESIKSNLQELQRQ